MSIYQFHHPVKEIIWTGKPYTSEKIVKYISASSNMEKLNNGTNAHKSVFGFNLEITVILKEVLL